MSTELEVYNAGIFIGRFQPFHLGHLAGIRFALENVRLLYIILGSAEKSHEPQNPFTSGERIRMIKAALDEDRLDFRQWLVIPVPDMGSHALWVALVNSQVPKYEVVFSNDPLTLWLFRETNANVIEVPYHQRQDYSATEVRRRMVQNEKWEELVPGSVAEIIKEIGGIGRLKALQRTVKKEY